MAHLRWLTRDADAIGLGDGERQLIPSRSPELVALSYCISWLGAYTSIQLNIHAMSSSNQRLRQFWTGLASIAFGFSGIWSMHFLGMLASNFDVPIDLNKPLATLSAVAAICLTFAASVCDDDWQTRFIISAFHRFSRFLTRNTSSNPEDLEYAPLYLDTPTASSFVIDPRLSLDDEHHRVDANISESHGRRSRVQFGDDGEEGNDASISEARTAQDWGPWLLELYNELSVYHLIRAVLLVLAIVCTHFLAIWAMEIKDGRLEWEFWRLAPPVTFAIVLCFGARLAMLDMEMFIGRQFIVATLFATSVCSTHYFGMAATMMITSSPPIDHGGFPIYVTWTIVAGAITVCIVANALLANRAIVARQRMEETIRTKRRLWRILAEKEAAERAHQLKQEFISVASHEIRTPLHTVVGYTELLSQTPLTQEQSTYLMNIKHACHAINVIAENVLDFSKLERANTEVEARACEVEPRKMLDGIARMASFVESRPDHRGVETIISVSPRVPFSVMLDETYMLRILMNLYSNAAKFTKNGYINIEVDFDPDTHRLVVVVRDTGIGIPPTLREAIFEPFRQADSSLTRAHYGAGLGLSIVKHLVQRMRGVVTVDSVLGEGSTFTVAIPVQVAQPSTLEVPVKRRRVKIICAEPRSERLYVDLWTHLGWDASVGSPRSSGEDLRYDTDVVWTDAETAIKYPTIASLMTNNCQSPTICIVHTHARELLPLGQLVNAESVFLAKQPVVLHAVVEYLESPSRCEKPTVVGAHSPPSNMLLSTGQHTAQTARLLSASLSGSIVLPTVIPEFSDVTRTTPSIEANHPKMVLLVEDNLINQRLGKRTLEKLGYKATTADNGHQAVSIILNGGIDRCLMDCQMPVMDGFAATKKIRELEAEGQLPGRLRIIALTANVTPESELQCRNAGMDDFLAKPLQLDALRAALEAS